MIKWAVGIASILCTCLAWAPCRAERAYVTNPSKITVRSAPGIDKKIIAMVSLDEPVEVLESEEGWKRVRLLAPKWNNKEGWIVSGFLTTRIPWEAQASSLREENAQLKEKLTKIEAEWRELTGEREGIKGKLAENTQAFSEMQRKYQRLKEEAGGYLKLKKEYEAAEQKMQEALTRAETLTRENEEIRSSQRNRWFLTGGAVMLVGLVFGLVLGRRERRRKSSYY